jgi:hypothetical protein
MDERVFDLLVAIAFWPASSARLIGLGGGVIITLCSCWPRRDIRYVWRRCARLSRLV